MSFKEFYVTCNPPLLLDGVDEITNHVKDCFQDDVVLEILYEPDVPWFKVIADESYQAQITKSITTRVREFYDDDPESLVEQGNALGDLTGGKKFCNWSAYQADFRCETEWKQYWPYMVPETMRDSSSIRLWRGVETCGAETFDNMLNKLSLAFKSSRMPNDFAAFQKLVGRDIDVGHNMKQDLLYITSPTSQRRVNELLAKLDNIASIYNPKSFRQDQLVQIGHIVIANTQKMPTLAFQPFAHLRLTQRTFVQPEIFEKRDIKQEYNDLMRAYTIRCVKDGDEPIKSDVALELEDGTSTKCGMLSTPFTDYKFKSRQPAVVESRIGRYTASKNRMINKWRSRVSDADEMVPSEYTDGQHLSALLPIKRPFTDSERSTSNVDSFDHSIKGEDIDEELDLSLYGPKKEEEEEEEVSLLLSFDAIQDDATLDDSQTYQVDEAASPAKESVSLLDLDESIDDKPTAAGASTSGADSEDMKTAARGADEHPLTRLVNFYLQRFTPILKILSGRAKLEVQLGRICVSQVPGSLLQDNETSLKVMLHNLEIKMAAPQHFQFLPVLSTLMDDANMILKADPETGAGWDFVSAHASYNFAITPNGDAPNSFVVEVDADSYDYQCRESWSELLSIYLHHGKSDWDARVHAANSPVRDSDLEDDLAVRLVGSLKVTPNSIDDGVVLEIMDLHNQYRAMVSSVEVKQTVKYQSRANNDVQLNVSIHRLLEKGRGLIRPKTSPFPGMTTSWKFPSVHCKNGSPKVWVEASISHKVLDKILEENTDLEFGQTTDWDVDGFCSEGYFGAMCQAASGLIAQMDSVGITNDNGHAKRMESERRQLPQPNLTVRK